MLKLRTILLYNFPYYLLLIIVLITTAIRILLPKSSIYNLNTNVITGTIISKEENNNHIKLIIKNKEKILVNYYLKDREKFSYNLGDKIKVTGEISVPEKNTTENLFNYQKYLKHQNIFYIFRATNLKRLSKNRNIYYYIKQKIINSLNNNPYLYTFIIGDKSKLDKAITKSYQKNGISHLFAISGMHITLLSSIALAILKKLKVKEEKRYFITSLFLLFYLSITGLAASITRGVLFFILFSLNKVYYFYIKKTNLFIIALSISLLINPFYIYDIGFWYSYSISLSLLVITEKLRSNNYIITLLKISLTSFLVSLPISLYNFYQINLLSIIYNLIFVPFVSFVIFPLSLITFICPFLIPLFNLMTSILEKTSLFLSKANFLIFTFPRLNIFLYLIYIVLVVIYLWGLVHNKKKLIYPIIVLLLFHYLSPYLSKATYIKVLDVGQGDSILLHKNNTNILIDTGGIISYHDTSPYSVVESVTIPMLKSKGIRKIDYLILSHGDFDHIGESINLINNFKVDKVIFNIGDYNDIENKLIKVLNDKNIKYYQDVEVINLDDSKLQFLNTKEYDNENDNSNVIYFNYNNYQFLFMGDASITREKDILDKYNLTDIDFLKVGHHGSNTSSSKYFIDSISPKYSLISVGKNNRYGHPRNSVLEALSNSKIYRTDLDGSIEIKLNKNGYAVRTCS